MQPTSPNRPSRRLGRYELLGRLAMGGMGEIFLARLEGAAGFEKLYVIKKILPHLAQDPRFRNMLVDEAQIASRMSHPNVCQIYELEETAGQLYIVMEYLEGVTVLPLLRRASRDQTQLPLGFVAGVIVQTCEALHYAHELTDREGQALNIIHRDVTPSNIFVTESGVAKVLDFGIAKVKNASAQTQTGTVKGKYAYMAPEQLRGAELDRRVDVFALGVVMFEMLALRRLFQRKTDYLTFRAVMEQEIPDLRMYRPDVPEGVVAVVNWALAREPEHRLTSAREFGSNLLDACGTQRPMSNGEIADYLRHNCIDIVRKRSASMLLLTKRTDESVRTPLPMVDFGGANDQESDTSEEEFPSIESDYAVLAPRVSSLPAPRLSRETSAPQPFGNDPSTTMANRLDFSGVGAMQPASVPSLRPTRAWVMPVVGAGLLATTVASLVLVWIRSQPAPPSSPVVIVQSELDATVATPMVDAGALSVDAGPPTQAPPDAPVAKPPRPKNDGQAVRERIIACKPLLDGEQNRDVQNLRIKTDAQGKAILVELEPAHNTKTPFGRCVVESVGRLTLREYKGSSVTLTLRAK